MFGRMIVGALLRQKKKMAMIAFTVALGSSLATAMLCVMLGVGEKVNRELKAYGANIRVLPKEASLLGDLYGLSDDAPAYLPEASLPALKTIFWGHNIVDFAPYLEARASLSGRDAQIPLVGTWFNRRLELPTGETLDTGIRNLRGWWKVRGEWISDEGEGAMIGGLLAERYGLQNGDTLVLTIRERTKTFTIRGIFDSGGDEDGSVFVPLAAAQDLAGRGGLVSSVEVSALTTPDNELSRKAARNFKSLSIAEYEVWYCTAYVSSICHQIVEAIPDSVAKPIRRVAESEGVILQKTQLLMLLITLLALAAAALAISNLVTAAVMERGPELGLLKAVGARDYAVSALFLTEIGVASIAGGLSGYFAGLAFARIIGRAVFGSAIEGMPGIFPLVAVLVVLVTLAGSLPAVRFLLSLRPAEILHGR